MKSDIINHIIIRNDYKSYLEIGLSKGVNFDLIQCDRKIGVDPVGVNIDGELHVVPSDEFFAYFNDPIDFVFIDGLHLKEQVLRDVENSLGLLTDHGTIMMHDCNPQTYDQQTRRKNPKRWCGDVWKAWVELRQREDIHQVCIEEYFGCGIIRKGTQTPLHVDISYSGLEQNRKEWLNLISEEEFYDL